MHAAISFWNHNWKLHNYNVSKKHMLSSIMKKNCLTYNRGHTIDRCIKITSAVNLMCITKIQFNSKIITSNVRIQTRTCVTNLGTSSGDTGKSVMVKNHIKEIQKLNKSQSNECCSQVWKVL